MRATFLALLTACATSCAPPAPPASRSDPPAAQSAPPSAADPYAVALAGAAASGQWFFRSDAGVIGAGFGAPQSEFQFSITCAAPPGKISIVSGRELSPDQDTTLRLFTTTQALDLPARSFNEGLPSVTAEIAADAAVKQPLIDMLGAPQARFGVEIGGEREVYPWDESIARALAACGS